jgi:diguanylate cyclase (GGDEF)-like protein/PAS domain S-box-containing protein
MYMDVNGAACLLVAERDEDDRLVRRLLAGSGCELHRDGPEAVAERPFDVALVAAGDGGLEIARALLARAPQVPVIMLSPHPDLACDLAAAAAGVADYLVLGELDGALLERSLRYAIASQRARGALAESEERYALAVRGANDGIWDWDLRSGRFYCSPRCKEMLGYTPEEIEDAIGEWLGRVHPDDRAAVRSALQAHVDGETQHFESEHRLRARDGDYRWMLARGSAVRDADGRATRVAGSLSDVTDRKRTEARLQHDALHDGLTGLPNRVLFLDRLEQAMRRAARSGDDVVCAVLFVDLDRFKVVNDSLGHQAGDELLTAVARRLESALRPGDTVARLGGDEFTVLLEEISDVHEATRVAERIHATLADSFRIADRELVVGASVGIALASSESRPEELVRDADVAMYRAKAERRGRHEVFDVRMHAELVARLDVETELRAAIESRSLQVLYQPIVQTATGRIAGFEALCRWPGALGRALEPAEFVAVADETGLIVPLGAFVLEEACRQVAAWRRTPASEELTLSVNVSGRQLHEASFPDAVAAALATSELDPRALRLEVAEAALAAEPDAVRATLAALLERLGVRSRIDDFGTGAASLRLLHRFPGDAVKIDRSLVLAMGSDAGSYEIVKAIVGLAHTLGLEVVAEGVETRERLDVLKVLGCEYAQGFLFSAPLQAAEAAALLEAGAAGAVL